MALPGRDAVVKLGTFVYIVQKEQCYGRDGEFVETRKIPGKITEVVDEETFMVTHYGPPHHFTQRGRKYGTYTIKIPKSRLSVRIPNPEDPMEL